MDITTTIPTIYITALEEKGMTQEQIKAFFQQVLSELTQYVLASDPDSESFKDFKEYVLEETLESLLDPE